MEILSVFVDEYNNPVTSGISPVIRIRDVSTKLLVVADEPMEAVGDGFWWYNFDACDEGKDYTIRACAPTLPLSYRYKYASTGEYNNNFVELQLAVDNIDVRTTLIRKFHTNRLELDDGDTGNWILYDDDDSSPLLIFNVTDKNGDLIVQQTNIPSKRSKGY